ncbi:MAG: hypothetical protein QOI12_312 [Alphaproteobacteria bacterium]|nr:hypothetical protein [Alphaproteobacteria bacterium]
MMRPGLTISTIGHVAVLLWGVVAFAAKPYVAHSTDALPVSVISDTEFSELTAGSRTAPKVETPKPLVEKLAERTPVENPTAKIEKTEVKATTDAPPPIPEPKPAAPAEKKPAEPKRDPIADAIKKDIARKPDPKKAETKAPTPAKKPDQQNSKFDPKQVAALLDKRTPQRTAATGDVVNTTVSLGAPRGAASQLSMSELDALRLRLAQLWNPPAGARNPEELTVQIRMKLNPDGTLAGPPMVMTSGRSPLFMAARDSAIRAVFRGQPFDMLKPEHYELWQDIEITFDPRDMIRG